MSAPADRTIAGNWPSVAANEQDAEPGLMKMNGPNVSTPQRRQREVGLVESGLLVAVRGCTQGSVKTPGPGVIVALKGAAVAAFFQHQLAASMAADVGVGPKRPRLIADDDDRDLTQSAGQKVASFRDLLDSADIVPTRREDALLLRVGIDWGRCTTRQEGFVLGRAPRAVRRPGRSSYPPHFMLRQLGAELKQRTHGVGGG